MKVSAEKHWVALLTPATGGPEGWYPLSVAVFRMVEAAGWTGELGEPTWVWAGCLASGLLLGTALVAAWYLIAWPIRRLRRS